MKIFNIISAIIFLGLSAYIAITAGSFPGQQGSLSPAFFPELISGLLAAFAISQLLFAIFRPSKEATPEKPQRTLVLVVLCLIVYAIILPIAGFLVTTPSFLFVSGLIVADDLRKWWKTVLVSSVVTTGVIYVLFSVMLKVPLP